MNHSAPMLFQRIFSECNSTFTDGIHFYLFIPAVISPTISSIYVMCIQVLGELYAHSEPQEAG